MGNRDKEHFDNYTEQNRVKHKILTAYLPAYFYALKRGGKRFHYIDGFAGPGRYEGTFPGSPLLVVDKINDAGVASCTAVSCVESNKNFCAKLEETLNAYPGVSHLFDNPRVRNGKFEEHVDELLSHPVYDTRRQGRDVATFAFVDPCGVSGVRLDDLVRLLQLPYGECCPSSSKWNRFSDYLVESLVPHGHVTRRAAESANDALRWCFS